MTTIATHLDREASIPTITSNSFHILGKAMDTVERRRIQEYAGFIDMQCKTVYWGQILGRERHELDAADDGWASPLRTVFVSHMDVELATQYQSAGRKLDISRPPNDD